MANDSPYGLAAALWTSDVSRALSTARAIRAGVVWVNDTQIAPLQAPWGGFKQSGHRPRARQRTGWTTTSRRSTSTSTTRSEAASQ